MGARVGCLSFSISKVSFFYDVFLCTSTLILCLQYRPAFSKVGAGVSALACVGNLMHGGCVVAVIDLADFCILGGSHQQTKMLTYRALLSNLSGVAEFEMSELDISRVRWKL